MAKGDDMAYRAFHDAYVDRLSRYLLVATSGDEHAVRDALQETLTRVVRHIRVFADEATFWSWLTVLARSALFDAHRKRRRYFAFLDRFRREATLAPGGEDCFRADARLEDLLRRHLLLLSAEERDLVEWKYFERRSVHAIAAQLQTTEKSVESRLTRLRRKLKDAVLNELRHESSD